MQSAALEPSSCVISALQCIPVISAKVKLAQISTFKIKTRHNFQGFCFEHSRLSLSQSTRDSLKYFEISISPHIRFAESRKR